METELFYLGLYLCSLVSMVHVPNEKETLNFRDKLAFLKSPKSVRIICFGAVVNLLLLLFFLLAVDFKVLLLNFSYLDMVDPEKIGISSYPILVLYKKTVIINAILCFFFFGFLSTLKLKHVAYFKWIYFFIGVFFWIYLLGNNSRTSGLIWVGLLGAIFLFTTPSKWQKAKMFMIVCLIAMSYMSALQGRQKYQQGISQIPRNISLIQSTGMDEIKFYARNIFGGAWVFSEAKDMNGDYPEKYKVLSFSPFPSSIDNFSSYLKYQNRISVFEPYSANVEVYHFGGGYILLYFLILLIGLSLLNKTIKENRFIGYLMALPAYLFFIAYQQYPLRSNFRYFFISIILCFIFLKLKAKTKPNTI
ncbi:hypothetical protein [Ochrovirga pacifica]|uniref:hypothetical protein n=1 Tax=Ochrovirga pacifica TaxID=1042376 RepID=UPI0011129ADC|nr:hypothetical protein [Ochrovirga pacifica]